MPARPQAAHEVSGQRRQAPHWPPAGRSEPVLSPQETPSREFCLPGERGVTFSPLRHPWIGWQGLEPPAGTPAAEPGDRVSQFEVI